MKMEIPTGDNPPISQRPYGLALKHVQWVSGGGGNARKGRGDYAKHFPMGQPHSNSPKEDCSRGAPQEEDVCRL